MPSLPRNMHSRSTYCQRARTFCCLEKILGTEAFDVALAATAGRADATTTTAILISVLSLE